MKQRDTHLYLVESGLGLAKLGVAPDPHKRLRELQVGSPVRLKLALTAPYPTRAKARAMAEALARQFAPRRAHGQWYRVTTAELRRALASRAIREAPARRTAGEARSPRPPGRGRRAPTEKERAYQRRRRRERAARQKRAAKLLGRGLTQVAVAAAVGVTARTLRNWRRTPGFTRQLEREHARAEHARAGSGREAEQAPPWARRAPRGASARAAPAEAPAAAPASSAARPRQPASGRLARGGVPLFPDTAEGRAARLAYYEARKLEQLPHSLHDYYDVIGGRETPAERRAREGRTPGRR